MTIDNISSFVVDKSKPVVCRVNFTDLIFDLKDAINNEDWESVRQVVSDLENEPLKIERVKENIKDITLWLS